MHGAVNDLQACRLWEAGQCSADATAAAPADADYCQGGTTFKCPAGYQRAAPGAPGAELAHEGVEDCVLCPAGSACPTSTAEDCAEGYLCRAYAEDL
jgi:hypothetical protein